MSTPSSTQPFLSPAVQDLYQSMGMDFAIIDTQGGDASTQSLTNTCPNRENQKRSLEIAKLLARHGYTAPTYDGAGLGPATSHGGRKQYYYILSTKNAAAGGAVALPPIWTTAYAESRDGEDMNAVLSLVALNAIHERLGLGYGSGMTREAMHAAQASLERLESKSQYRAHQTELDGYRRKLVESQMASDLGTERELSRSLGLPIGETNARELFERFSGGGNGAWERRIEEPRYCDYDPVGRYGLDPEGERPDLRCFAQVLEAYSIGASTFKLSRADLNALKGINDEIASTWPGLSPLTDKVRAMLDKEEVVNYLPVSDMTEVYRTKFQEILAAQATTQAPASSQPSSSKAPSRTERRRTQQALAKGKSAMAAARSSVTTLTDKPFEPYFYKAAAQALAGGLEGAASTDRAVLVRQYLHHYTTGEPVVSAGQVVSLFPIPSIVKHLKALSTQQSSHIASSILDGPSGEIARLAWKDLTRKE